MLKLNLETQFSQNIFHPTYYSTHLLFTNRIESNVCYPSVGGYKSSINHRFSFFFFFNRFDSNRRDFIDTISLSFFPPGVQWRKGVEKAAAMFWNFLPSPDRLFR